MAENQKNNSIISVEIKTTWQSKVGIRDKYVNEAQNRGKDLYIFKGNDAMLIPWGKIDLVKVGKSEFPVPDRYSNESHYLIYFDWKPTTLQLSLF